MKPAAGELGWAGVVRIGLVQASIGAVVVLMTSTLNRIMVVELALAAFVPGALVALHFAIQFVARPRVGHRADGRRRTPLILAGMAILSFGGIAATAATTLIAADRALGLAAAAVAFAIIGVGVGAAGTPLLALLADRVPVARRGRAVGLVWLMMIAGFVLTTAIVAHLIDPFSMARLLVAATAVCVTALLVTALALAGLEPALPAGASPSAPGDFAAAIRDVWAAAATRRFAIFILVAMLAYSAQDLVLEPFTGTVFGLDPAGSTRITSLHQGGMLVGMILAAAASARWGRLSSWAAAGCVASALAFVGLAATPALASLAALRLVIAILGFANGVFAIGALGSMMVEARGPRSGLRMGIFGAAQAAAYAIGAFLGAAGSDVGRAISGSPADGYVAVFLAEALLFTLAAGIVTRRPRASDRIDLNTAPDGDALLAGLG